MDPSLVDDKVFYGVSCRPRGGLTACRTFATTAIAQEMTRPIAFDSRCEKGSAPRAASSCDLSRYSASGRVRLRVASSASGVCDSRSSYSTTSHLKKFFIHSACRKARPYHNSGNAPVVAAKLADASRDCSIAVDDYLDTTMYCVDVYSLTNHRHLVVRPGNAVISCILVPLEYMLTSPYLMCKYFV